MTSNLDEVFPVRLDKTIALRNAQQNDNTEFPDNETLLGITVSFITAHAPFQLNLLHTFKKHNDKPAIHSHF